MNRPGTPHSPPHSPCWSSLLCLAGRLARLGFLADLLSRPVLVGYMAGIAVIMIAGQLGRVMGIEVFGDSPLEQIRTPSGTWPTPTRSPSC